MSFGFRSACKAEGASVGISAEIDCKTLEEDADFGLKVKSFDTGVVLGGGLDFPLANDRRFTVGARCICGLSDVIELFTVQNRAIQLALRCPSAEPSGANQRAAYGGAARWRSVTIGTPCSARRVRNRTLVSVISKSESRVLYA